MIAGDSEMLQGSISSALVDSMESNENRDVLSPEDVAWADSCLVKDPEISGGDWSSLKNVLLEILNLQPESHDASEPGSDDLPRGTGILIHPSNEAENLQSRVVTDDEDVFKVWDLGIPDEEDELIKQLNKALAENPAQSTPSSSDDPGAGKKLKEESLDTSIHGISDLSLDQHS
ncbi:hypothetical protein OIU74_004006 [Salix koriyanagi]|uniref:Uncharacterized protein n=1 Tax=Salix koriyanagi TaxID=2511006 RepID=A0A9Q0UZK6_9ROSI|nr:hypothetical protein OIU74_004006 [Salix koriyanagi]